jgi:tetratricopeptide (TPR) repeat protein
MMRRLSDILMVAVVATSLLAAPAPALAQGARSRGGTHEPVDAVTAQAIDLYARHHYSEAREALARALAANPDNAAARTARGRLLYEVDGDIDGALADLEQAVAVAPGSASAHAWLGQVLAAQASRDGMFKAAAVAKRGRAELEQAVALAPRDAQIRLALLRFYLTAPTLAGGSVERAREQAGELGHVDQPLGIQAEGEIAEAERDSRGAEARFREAFTADPGDPGVCNALGYFLLRRRRPDAAVDVLRSCVRIAASDPNAHDSLGEALLAAGKVADAEAAYRRALELDPTFASSLLGLGQCLEKQSLWGEARGAYQRCLAVQPRGPLAEAARARLKELAYRRS